MSDSPVTSEQANDTNEAQPRSEETALLANASQLFHSRLQLEEAVALLARHVARRLDAGCLFLLADAARGQLRVWTHQTLSGPKPDVDGAALGALLLRHSQNGAVELAVSAGTADTELRAALAGLVAQNFMAVPIAQGPEFFGFVLLTRAAGQSDLGERERRLMLALAPQVAGAVHGARILAEERWQRQKAELMFQASKAIHTELHFDQAVREIALLLKQSIKVPWVGLFEYTQGTHALGLLGSTAEPAVDLRLSSQSFMLAAWPEAEQVLKDPAGATTVPLAAPLAGALGQSGSVWALPLVHKHVPQGLLLIAPSGDAPIEPEALEVAVGIGELVALAIANQHLIDQEAKARIQIIRSQAAAQEREVLLRQIVHDLRNATQAMSLVVEDMDLAMGENSQLRANLATIDNQITFISNFLKEKLNWIQQGDRFHPPEPTALADVFADLEGRYGPAARTKHQRLIVSSPELTKLPLSSVQIEQIVGNLLDNAIKYTQAHGEVRLWAEVSDGWVTIYVADNGPGIPASAQARLGEVGYRGQADQEGAGIGLANVRQLVTRAGGLFGLSSSETTGTTFHVSLPTTTWGRVIS